MYFQREEEKTQLTGTAWAPGKRDLKSHSQTGKPLLTFSGEAVFRARPLWKIKSFMKRKDQTGGSENANANTGGRCRKRLQSWLKAAWLISISNLAVTNRWLPLKDATKGMWLQVLKDEIFKALEEFSLGNWGRKLLTWKTKEEITEVKLPTSDTRTQSQRTGTYRKESLHRVTAGRAMWDEAHVRPQAYGQSITFSVFQLFWAACRDQLCTLYCMYTLYSFQQFRTV